MTETSPPRSDAGAGPDAASGPPASGPPASDPARSSLLSRLGLHRPELRAWALYDWANSAFVLVVITAVFPIYYQDVAARDLVAAHGADQATFYFGLVTTAALGLVAVLSPLLGAFGDFLGKRKALLAAFLGLGVTATAALGLVGPGDWQLALALFALGNIGVSVSFVFYDSLLPHIAGGDELDRVSTAGYALGYLGSGLLLILLLALIQNPTSFGLPDAGVATRISFVAVAVWWTLFSIPLFRRVPEPPREIERDEVPGASPLRVTFDRLGETFRDLRGNYKEAFKMLLAMLIYNDGIGTIIRMAAIYAAGKDLPRTAIIGAILLVQFVGIPFAFLFGLAAGKVGAKRAVLFALVVYTGISILAYRMETELEFYVLAVLVGCVQGGAQGLSRSLFASMVPRHKASEFFGFFSVFEKFAGIFGPLIFSLAIALTGSSQEAILSVILFFLVGGVILARVDVDEGRRQAARSDRILAETVAAETVGAEPSGAGGEGGSAV